MGMGDFLGDLKKKLKYISNFWQFIWFGCKTFLGELPLTMDPWILNYGLEFLINVSKLINIS